MARTLSIVALELLGAATLSGCLEADLPEGTEEQFATATPTPPPPTRPGDPCEYEWRCGGNSPVVDVHAGRVEFHDLNLGGLPNDAGLVLETVNGRAQLWLGGAPHDLYIGGDGLFAPDGYGGYLEGAALAGGELLMFDSAGEKMWLRIADARTMTYPFPEGSADPLTVYKLEVLTDSAGAYRNLCANPTEYDAMGMLPDEALVYGGDRFDTYFKTIHPLAGENWLNIGCAGHTLAKLHLTRNTTASQVGSANQTTHDERQAAFKLLTGDYCGTGVSFTLPGQSLQWMGEGYQAKNEYNAWLPHDQIEARWDANGATCLSVPRLEWSSLADAPTTFPDVRKMIDVECANAGIVLDKCDPDKSTELDGKSWVSALSDVP
jgi:hypothetical protein